MPTIPFIRFDQMFPPDMLQEQGYDEPTPYVPEHQYADQLGQMIQHFPQRNDPGILRNIVASIAGFGGGPQAAEDVQYAPYNRELEDWKAKYQPTYQAATLERYENANERQLARQRDQFNIQNRRADIEERKAENKEKIDREKVEISRTRAAAYDYHQRHPLAKFQQDKAGNIIAIDPLTHKAEYVPDPVTGEPIKGIKLPEQDHINLDVKKFREEEQIRQSDALKRIEAQGEQSRLTKKTPGAARLGADGKPLSPAATKVDRYNRARQLLDANPDYEGIIELGKGNDFKINSAGISKDEYDMIFNYIYGTAGPVAGQDINLDSGAPAPNSSKPQATPDMIDRAKQGEVRGDTEPVVKSGPKLKNPEDRIIVQAPDGGARFSLPREQKELALKKGYKVIQE